MMSHLEMIEKNMKRMAPVNRLMPRGCNYGGR